jgi:replicative DNA helicase
MDNCFFLPENEKNEIQEYFQKKNRLNSKLITAYDEMMDIRSKWRDIPTSSTAINTLLNGGLKRNVITELSGRGATGKTQFCMMMCANVQMTNTVLVQYQAMYFIIQNRNIDILIRKIRTVRCANRNYFNIQRIRMLLLIIYLCGRQFLLMN